MDNTKYEHINPRGHSDLLSVKNSIIRQISEHRERKYQRDRHAVKDLSLLANINQNAKYSQALLEDQSRKRLEDFKGGRLASSELQSPFMSRDVVNESPLQPSRLSHARNLSMMTPSHFNYESYPELL